MERERGTSPHVCSSGTVEHFILSIVLTEECNLRCRYCYQRSREKGAMSLATAQGAVANALTSDNAFHRVIIELIGGEVFLYWDLVVQLIDWTISESGRWHKQFSYFIDTNGTLLDDEKKDWLRRRRGYVTVGLSVDGTPEMHDINRGRSFRRIAEHLPFFAETWPDQPVKMTISPWTIGSVFEGIIHIMRNGLKVAANLPFEDIWGSGAEKKLLVERFTGQIEKLVAFFGNNAELPLPSIISLPIHSLYSPADRDRPWCGSGRSMAAVDVDGRMLPCNRYAKMSFDTKLLGTPIAPDISKCTSCFYKPACPTCEAHNMEINGNPDSRTSFHCEFIKAQIWGTAQVRAMRLDRMVNDLRKGKMPTPAIDGMAKERLLAFAAIQLTQIADLLERLESTPAEVSD